MQLTRSAAVLRGRAGGRRASGMSSRAQLPTESGMGARESELAGGGVASWGASVSGDDEYELLCAHRGGTRVTMVRHQRKVPKLNKKPPHRKAVLRALTTQLLEHGRIKTTRARAKALRREVDWVITLAKKGREHDKRIVRPLLRTIFALPDMAMSALLDVILFFQAKGWVYDNELVDAVFSNAPERYRDRSGGYTRIQRTMPRRGDNAEMVRLFYSVRKK